MEKVFVSVKDFAENTAISVVTVRRWIKSGKLRSVKIGSRVLIPMAEVYRMEKGEFK